MISFPSPTAQIKKYWPKELLGFYFEVRSALTSVFAIVTDGLIYKVNRRLHGLLCLKVIREQVEENLER